MHAFVQVRLGPWLMAGLPVLFLLGMLIAPVGRLLLEGVWPEQGGVATLWLAPWQDPYVRWRMLWSALQAALTCGGGRTRRGWGSSGERKHTPGKGERRGAPQRDAWPKSHFGRRFSSLRLGEGFSPGGGAAGVFRKRCESVCVKKRLRTGTKIRLMASRVKPNSARGDQSRGGGTCRRRCALCWRTQGVQPTWHGGTPIAAARPGVQSAHVKLKISTINASGGLASCATRL